VLSTYATGADALGRLVAQRICRAGSLDRVLWKPAHRRAAGGPGEIRALRGALPAGPIEIREGPLAIQVDVTGQKSGAYLDLRGLRRWLLEQDLSGARVLNLFSYTGTLGLAARTAGAGSVCNVDSSRAAIEMAARWHGGGSDDVVADVFEWLPRLDRDRAFELVIADPPPMTSRMDQVAGALAAYRRLYRAAAPHVAPGGCIVACCCTSRIDAKSFENAVRAGLGKEFRLERRIPAEPDHPVGFAEADYLKVLVLYRGTS